MLVLCMCTVAYKRRKYTNTFNIDNSGISSQHRIDPGFPFPVSQFCKLKEKIDFFRHRLESRDRRGNAVTCQSSLN